MRPILQLTLAVAPVAATAVLGYVAVLTNLPWYSELAKPDYTPPDWLFGPVWAVLYLLMAVAVWRVLRRSPQKKHRQAALVSFFIHLALNATWPWLFFVAHDPQAALINIMLQTAAIAVTVLLFALVDVVAALCLVPVALWVGFAAVLNAAIWKLN
jgi:benzodiazapine receptor